MPLSPAALFQALRLVTLSLIAALLAGRCLAASAQTAADDVVVRTALPRTQAYQSVPLDLDILGASAGQLSRYGFPPRPDPLRSPLSYAAWKDAVIGMRRIAPVLVPVAIYHGPMQAMASAGNQAATSSNWSGYVAAADALSYGGQSITSIDGDWMVPIAQPAFNACGHHRNGADVYSSTWVGIDGSGSADVVQAGTESDSVCGAGQISPYQGAWYEWYPLNEVRITNLAVSPGAAMSVHVWVSSATRGHAYVADKSAHVAVSLAFDAPAGVRALGNSGEWVIERPTVEGQLATLTNYVQEFFANAEAHTGSGLDYAPGLAPPSGQTAPLRIDMTDDENGIISVPTLLGQSSIWFSDQGSAQSAKTGSSG